jgi:trigger factor
VVEVTFPEEYPVDYLKGRAATFDVTVNEVQTPKEAQADDSFAKSMGLESIEQLRGLLKGQVEQELNGLTRTHMKRQLLDQLAASHDFPVPQTMVEAEFEQIWKQLEHEASHEADPDAARTEMETERGEYRAIAERRVRLGLLLSDLGQRNGVEVSSQEMNQLIMQAAQQYRPEDRQRFIDYVRQEPMAAAQLRAPLYEDKVVDYIFSKAEITDRAVSREELEAAIEADEGHVHGPGCGHDHHDHDHAPAAEAAPAKKGKAKKADPVEATGEGEAAPAKKAKKAKAERGFGGSRWAAGEEAAAPPRSPARRRPMPRPISG